MKRSVFLVSGLGIAAASSAGSPALARALHAPGTATSLSVTVRRNRFDGGLPGGCGSHRRRRSSPHSGYTLREALSGA